MFNRFKYLSFVVIILLACNSNNKPKKILKQNNYNRLDTLQYYGLEDSNKLSLVKGLFYRNSTGHLYQRTIAQIVNDESIKSGTLLWKEYFNGDITQDLDPETFEQLDGWYAVDKNFVYYYRPESGGMRIIKMDSADRNTFKVLKDHYRYAMDKKHVFEDMNIIKSLDPNNLKTNYSKGKIVSLQSGPMIYKTD